MRAVMRVGVSVASALIALLSTRGSVMRTAVLRGALTLMVVLVVTAVFARAQEKPAADTREIRGSCAPSGRGFAENARDRAAVVVLVNVLSAPERRLSPWQRLARTEVLETLKGRSGSPVLDVLVDDGEGLKMGAGERWLLALPGVGTPFVQGGCEVFAVKVEGNDAVGRVLSNVPYRATVEMHVIPLERIRDMLRDGR